MKKMEQLKFDRKCECDWCKNVEICSVTNYGTTNYSRLVCLECALSINCNDKALHGEIYFDLNNSTIIFPNNPKFIDCTKDDEE